MTLSDQEDLRAALRALSEAERRLGDVVETSLDTDQHFELSSIRTDIRRHKLLIRRMNANDS